MRDITDNMTDKAIVNTTKKWYSANQRYLRCGYTTGTCAAAAAKAAAWLLLTGQKPEQVTIKTPKGPEIVIDVAEAGRQAGEDGLDAATCAVKKDSGDDPDITNGILVYATVRPEPSGAMLIDGGAGVGRVTKPGLDQPVGMAAINSTPRQMIAQALREVCEAAGYSGGLSAVISIPAGEALAARTFNPRLGISGGLSILGTSGIVEPMSDSALIDTIRVELRVLAAAGRSSVILTPGNYGESFLLDRLNGPEGPEAVFTSTIIKCSNFIGDSIAAAVECGFRRILLAGHIGKLVKLAIGLMNTHSRYGDGRLETLVTCALKAGGDLALLRQIADCATTEAALTLLEEAGLMAAVALDLKERIAFYLSRQIPADAEIGFICFTGAGSFRPVFESGNVAQLLENWQ